MAATVSAPPQPTAYNGIIDSSQHKIKQFHEFQKLVAGALPLVDTYDGKYAVGIKSLPSQTQKIKSKSGATLNLLLVGQSGLGTYFNTSLSSIPMVPQRTNHLRQ